MYKGKSYIAIIPARGGSKRLPQKNILDLLGKPLIVWSIEAALKSKYIDEVIVTSDDPQILKIAKENGANILQRPNSLASDTATTFDAVKHLLDNTKFFDFLVLLQPTSPLRNSKHIEEAIEMGELKQADAIVSVCEMDHSPLWSNTLPVNGSMDNFLRDDIKNKRSQDLEKYYRINGALYICKIKPFLKEESFFLEKKSFSFIMNRTDSIDIDEKIDFKIAEILMKENILLSSLQ